MKDELAALRIDRGARADAGGRRLLVGTLLVGALAIAAVAIWWLLPGGTTAVATATARAAGSGPAGGGTVLNASGYVTARRRATVSSKITGKLVDVRVEEGRAVRAGEVLARLDDAQLVALVELAAAQATAARRAVDETFARRELAELTHQRFERLVREGVAGAAELDAARTEAAALAARLELDRQQAEVAERELALRRTELDDSVIRAPFDGIVISKDAQPGEMVSPVSAGGGFTRTGICTIVDMDSLEIEVDVNESYISRVQPGQPVEAVLDAYPDWRIPSHVITTIPAADRQKATVLVRIGFDALDPRILPDMGVKVAFQRPPDAGGGDEQPAERARVLVPASALRREGARDVLFVVRDGRAERRAVTVGARSGEEAEIASGLAAGERVVLDPPAELADRDKVVTR